MSAYTLLSRRCLTNRHVPYLPCLWDAQTHALDRDQDTHPHAHRLHRHNLQRLKRCTGPPTPPLPIYTLSGSNREHFLFGTTLSAQGLNGARSFSIGNSFGLSGEACGHQSPGPVVTGAQTLLRTFAPLVTNCECVVLSNEHLQYQHQTCAFIGNERSTHRHSCLEPSTKHLSLYRHHHIQRSRR